MTTDLTRPASPLNGPAGLRMPGRRLLARSALMPLLATTAWSLGVPALAAAATATAPMPPALRQLDQAAMTLFDAAEAGDWAGSRSALAQAKLAVLQLAHLQDAFLAANGAIGDYIEARNNLSADLIEADTALSVQDKRWLVSSADRIASRAGQLSRPFATGASGTAPRIETLLFLDRRMRRALVWGDDGGFRDARDAFKTVWSSLRTQLAGQPADKTQALDQALTRLATESSRANLKALDIAIRGLRDATP